MVRDALGREWQCATEQLDFIQPERFGLEYVAEDGSKQRPVMVHKALLGSIERFLSVYIEHTAGNFPVWLAPEQVRIASVNQEPETLDFVSKLKDEAVKNGLRIGVDNNNESVGKKIRNAEKQRIPYMLVVGVKEVESSEVTARVRSDIQVQHPATTLPYQNFFASVANEVKSRVGHSSL
jgi:threonyl-tRNA synthetase